MFSISTVASSTRMPTASARPPSVMMLIVSPSALSTMSDERIDSGIETAMMSVLRQLPRKTRIISAVRQAAMSASRTTPLIAAAHEHRLIGQRGDLERRRQLRLDHRGSLSRIPWTMSSVEASPVLMTDSSDGALPVDAHDVGLRREAVAHVRDVADVDHGAAARPSGPAGRSAPRA